RPSCPSRPHRERRPARHMPAGIARLLAAARRAGGERGRRGERGAAEQHAAAVGRALPGLVSILARTHDLLPSRTTQRKPTWLVEVSIGSAWRAAGRERGAKIGAAKGEAPLCPLPRVLNARAPGASRGCPR